MSSQPSGSVRGEEEPRSLHEACKRNDPALVRKLLAEGHDKDEVDKTKMGFTPLQWAVFEGSMDCLRELLAAGADKEATNRDGRTPLLIAATSTNLDCVKELLAAGCQKEARDNAGRTALMLADRMRRTMPSNNHLHKESVRVLAAAGCELPRGDVGLRFAAMYGLADHLKKMLQEGCDKEAKGGRGQALLMKAARFVRRFTHRFLTSAMLWQEANVAESQTPLMLAAAEGHSDCVKELLAAGCQKDARDNAGATPLMLAAAFGHVDCVRELLAAGAQKEARYDTEDGEGMTPLMFATKHGHTACVEALLAAGCEKPRGEAELMFAAKAGLTDLVRELLQEGVDKEVADAYSRTPLMWAAKNGHADCIRALLAAGAQKEAKDSDGRTASYYARDENCVKLFDEEVHVLLLLDSTPAMAGEPWRQLSAAYEAFRSSPHAASIIVSVQLCREESHNPALNARASLAFRRPAWDLPRLPASPGEDFPKVAAEPGLGVHHIVVLVVGPSPFVPRFVQGFRSERAKTKRRGHGPNSPTLVVGITLGEGLGVFADLREEMLAAGIPCWTQATGDEQMLAQALRSTIADGEVVRQTKGGMYSKYMLDIKWMSGDAAASLERAKIESAKDVMNALRRQAIAPKHSEMKLLLAGAALDDEADLRNLPLSVGLTLVAMDIKELVAQAIADSTLPEDVKGSIEGRTESLCQLFDELPEHLTAALDEKPLRFVEEVLTKLSPEHVQVFIHDMDATKELLKSLRPEQIPALLRDPAEFLGPALEELRGISCLLHEDQMNLQAEEELGSSELRGYGASEPEPAQGSGSTEVEQPAVSPRGPRVHEVAEGLVVQLEEGDVAVMHDSILMVAKSRVCQKHTLNFEVMAKDGPLQLPDKAIALSPIVDLSPDGVVFEEPILVILPVCIGATKAWRSLGDSSKWEVLPEARFHAGYAILYLDHFCKIAAGGDEPLEAAIKISCYMNSLLEAKWAITHAACGSCRNLLRSYANDEDVLQDYKPCKPASYPAGGYAHGQDLRLAWPHVSSLEPEPGQPEPGRLNFRRFPLVSSVPWPSPEPSFELQIVDSSETRRCRFRSGDAQPVADEDQDRAAEVRLQATATNTLQAVVQSLADSVASSPASSSAPSVLEGFEGSATSVTVKELLESAHSRQLQHRKQKRRQRPSVTVTALEQASQASSASAAAAAAPSVPSRRHLLLSGRFNSQEKLDYMAAVKSQLETLAIPVFMVETFGAGDAFGGQTAVGLYNALALVAFCSDDYGTKTGAQYETFVELRYAHQNDIHIIPVQLHDTFPPQPRDEEGRAQNALVLRRDIIRIQDIGMHDPPRVGQEIAAAWNALQRR